MHFLPLFFTLFTITLNGERVFMELGIVSFTIKREKQDFIIDLFLLAKEIKEKGNYI